MIEIREVYGQFKIIKETIISVYSVTKVLSCCFEVEKGTYWVSEGKISWSNKIDIISKEEFYKGIEFDNRKYFREVRENE